MILFKNYRENRLRKKFKDTEKRMTEIFNSIKLDYKPTIEFNYNLSKQMNYFGIYCPPTDEEKPNHIIINLTTIKSKNKIPIILCHELGHWYHVNKKSENFLSLKSIVENNKKERNKYFYNARTEIENFADEYGKMFSKYFGCELEYERYAIESKIDRIKTDSDYLEMMEYFRKLNKVS